jgi:hypothetical protein
MVLVGFRALRGEGGRLLYGRLQKLASKMRVDLAANLNG